MTTWISTMFHQGGPMMFVICYLLGPSAILAILHVVMARRWSAIASISAIVVILAVGLYGRHQGRSLTEAAIASSEPGDRAMMEEMGYREASRPIQFAGAVAGVLGVLVIIGEIRRRNRRA
jgi:DMSO reductase anchor subunit